MRLQVPYDSPTSTFEFDGSNVAKFTRLAPDVMAFGKRDKTSTVATTGRTHQTIQIDVVYVDDSSSTASKKFFDLDDVFALNEKKDWKFQVKGTDGTYTTPRYSAKVRMKSLSGEVKTGQPNKWLVTIVLEVVKLDSWA